MSRARMLVCALGLAAILPGQSASEKTKLSALLPARAPVRFYTSDLYQYIDGGAEAYHGYGMVTLAHQEFKAGAAEVTIDLYDMGDPLRAFGIYASERSPEYRFLDIGAEGYAAGEILNFV
jgi:hypothetical protein